MDQNPTRILAVFKWLDPRAHPLGDTWLLTICTILLALGVPWLASGVAADVAACALGVLALAMLHLGFAVVAARTAPTPGARTRLLTALHALGVIVVAFIWQRAGGLQNPLFLAVFTLPVIGAVFISRWQSYVTAAVSVVTVALLASGQVPQPHWQLPGLGAAGAWLDTAGWPAGGDRPFAAFYAPAGYYAVLLQVFAVVLFGCAVAAEYLRSVFDRLNTQVAMARNETLRSQELWSALVTELPLPAALVDADTNEILCASAGADREWGKGAAALAGRELFDVVPFTWSEPIEALIRGRDGVEPLCMVRAGDRLRATEVRVQHLARHGRRLALVTVSDTTEAFCVRAALDAAEHAALIVDAAGRVLAVNRPARAVFPEVQAGADVAGLVPEAGARARWWDPGPSRCRKLQLTVRRRLYRVTVTAVALPGEQARLYVLAFMPAPAGLAGADRGATILTAVMRQP